LGYQVKNRLQGAETLREYSVASLVVDRRIGRRTPTTFRTQVITKAKGVDRQISCCYRSSRIKQYFKAHRTLRTETVICDTRGGCR
jgi:hypothetical protein